MCVEQPAAQSRVSQLTQSSAAQDGARRAVLTRRAPTNLGQQSLPQASLQVADTTGRCWPASATSGVPPLCEAWWRATLPLTHGFGPGLLRATSEGAP